MEKMVIRDAELASMSPAERERTVRRMVERTRAIPNDELVETRSRLSHYETKHNMTSEHMRRLVLAGEMKETDEICDWLMLLDLRERLEAREKRQARP